VTILKGKDDLMIKINHRRERTIFYRKMNHLRNRRYSMESIFTETKKKPRHEIFGKKQR